MVGLYAIIALGILGVSLKSYWGVHQATAVHELEPVAMGLSEWQQAPWKKDGVAVKGVASADAALPVPSGVTVPPDAEGFSDL